jgi:diguanylate cyclase (GGDEF)-like protein
MGYLRVQSVAPRTAAFVHSQPALIQGDLATEPGTIRLVRLRLTLALIAMAVVPIAVAAPILSTALDSQRAAEQAQVERDAAHVASDVSARLSAVSARLVRTAASSSVGDFATGSKEALAGARDAVEVLSGGGADGIVVATLLDTRGRQQIRAVGGKAVKPGPTTSVDPLVGAALDAAQGAIQTGPVEPSDDGTAHLAMSAPVYSADSPSTAIGVVRVEVSLDELVRLAGTEQLGAGSARLVDRSGATIAPLDVPRAPSGGSIDAATQLPWRTDWTVRLVAPTRVAPPPLPLIGLLALFLAIIGVLVFWMARQVLRPAEELDRSRGRLQDMYQLARVDSLHDVITGLGNHRAFQEAFERQVNASRNGRGSLGLVLIDLDDFQAVNETGGHATGDAALAAFGQLIQGMLRPTDRAFRIGGDEFALLLSGADAEAASAVARRLLAMSMDSRSEPGAPAARSFSAGVSACPSLASDRRQLLDQADAALAWAKRHGRTSVETFDPGRHRTAAPAPADIEQTSVGIADVIARRLLRPVYQPIVDLKSGRVAGSEGLIRPLPGSGFADPGQLFVAAEATGRSVELDFACLEIVAAGAAAMGDESILTLNLSPRTLEADDFSAGQLVALVRTVGLDPTRIVLELTEREQIEEMERLRRNVTACRSAGFRLAADDVGAGNAGLRLLSQLQFDIVKIDLSLVQGGAVHEASMSVVGALQDLARRWGASVIAEGIETPSQLRVVRALDVGAGQGYLLGRPMTAEDLLALQATGVDIEGLAKKDAWLHRAARGGAGLITPANVR